MRASAATAENWTHGSGVQNKRQTGWHTQTILAQNVRHQWGAVQLFTVRQFCITFMALRKDAVWWREKVQLLPRITFKKCPWKPLSDRVNLKRRQTCHASCGRRRANESNIISGQVIVGNVKASDACKMQDRITEVTYSCRFKTSVPKFETSQGREMREGREKNRSSRWTNACYMLVR